MKRLKWISVIMLCTLVPHLYAIDLHNEDRFWAQNLVETWVLMDYDEDIVSFVDQEGRAVYQVLVRNANDNDSAEALLASINGALGAHSETIPFFFNGHEAALSESTWSTGSNTVRGYIISIDNRPILDKAEPYPHDYVLISFSIASEFDVYHDFLLSNLDGFAPLASEYPSPGTVSQFVRATGGSILQPFAATVPHNLERGASPPQLSPQPSPLAPLATLELPEPINANVEAAYATIQREARILNQFVDAPEDIQNAAWRRYYQMLYQDSWYDMRNTAEIIAERLEEQGIERLHYPDEILSWIQGFAYRRTGTLSDLEPAQVCIANESGDCDSLGLAYIAILEHLGIDSILMISRKHSHSLVGVDVDGSGARFPFMNQNWLIAELTAEVPIGSIAANQANSADWLGFALKFQPQ